MGLRETYGGMVEAALNKYVDDNLNAEKIKLELNAMIGKMVDDKLAGIKIAIKEAIDKIDGEVDLPSQEGN